MKKLICEILFGKNTLASGLVALTVVSSIALGCNCSKDFDLSNLANANDSNATNTSSNTVSRTSSSSKPDASTGKVPSDEQLQDMVKETLLDFNDSVRQEDFTEFHSKICKPWQKQTTPASLKTTFQSFITNNISIASIDPLEATFTDTPDVGRELGYKTLKLKGEYPTSPNVTKFELNYIPEGKDWKLSKIIVDTTSKF